MSKITGIGLKNFRVFKEMTEFHLAPLTILSGENSSGKSSIFKTIALLKENESNFREELSFNSETHQLGKADYIINEEDELVTFRFICQPTLVKVTEFTFQPRFVDRYVQRTIDISYSSPQNPKKSSLDFHKVKIYDGTQWVLDTKVNQNRLEVFINWPWLYKEFHKSFDYELRQQDTISSFLKSLSPKINISFHDINKVSEILELENLIRAERDELFEISKPIDEKIKLLRQRREEIRDKYIELIEDAILKLPKPKVVLNIDRLQKEFEKKEQETNKLISFKKEQIKDIENQAKKRFDIKADRTFPFRKAQRKMEYIQMLIQNGIEGYDLDLLEKEKAKYELEVVKHAVNSDWEDSLKEYTEDDRNAINKIKTEIKSLEDKIIDYQDEIYAIEDYKFQLCPTRLTIALNIKGIHNSKQEKIEFLKKKFVPNEELRSWIKKREEIEDTLIDQRNEEIEKLEIELHHYEEQYSELMKRDQELVNKKNQLDLKMRDESNKIPQEMNYEDKTREFLHDYLNKKPELEAKLLKSNVSIESDVFVNDFFSWVHHIFVTFGGAKGGEAEPAKQLYINVDIPELSKYTEFEMKFYGEQYEDKELERWRRFNHFVLSALKRYYDEINTFLSSNIKYIPAIRGVQKRLYKQVIPKTETSYWISQYINHYLDFDDDQTAFLEKWIRVFGIGKVIEVENTEGIMAALYIKDGDKSRNIADLGFGYTQLLGIIINILLINFEGNKKANSSEAYNLLLIEEPEANLHPSLQSKLADFFIDAHKVFGVHFVIETHSEYLIRKLQYAVSKSRVSSNHINIYYFYPPNKIPEGKNQVEQIKISEKGNLSQEFGQGFFDESERLIAKRKEATQIKELEEAKKELEEKYKTHIKCLVLTEDRKNLKDKNKPSFVPQPEKTLIWQLLDGLGFVMEEIEFMTYKSSTQLDIALGIAEAFEKMPNIKRVIIHQDSDGYYDSRKKKMEGRIRNHGLKKTIAFITKYYSIEGYFSTVEHLRHLYDDLSEEELKQIIGEGRKSKKVIQASFNALDDDDERVRILLDADPEKYIHSKELKKFLNEQLSKVSKHNINNICQSSPMLKDEHLSKLVKEIWPDE